MSDYYVSENDPATAKSRPNESASASMASTTHPPHGTILRHEGVIVALSERLMALLAQSTGAERAEARAVAAELARHCAAHAEFSAYHPLFERGAFSEAFARDPFAAACAAAGQIDARRKVMQGGRAP